MNHLPAAADPTGFNRGPMAVREASEEAIWLARVWQALRQHLVLIVGATIVGIALAAFLTARATPTYEAMASLQIQDKQPNLPEIFKTLSSGAELNTDMEVMRSRALVDDAASSLGLRLRLVEPRRVPRVALFTTVEVGTARPQAGTSSDLAGMTGS